METITERCACLDVHKAQVTACMRVPAPGRGDTEHVSEFATTVQGLGTLRDWLAAHAVSQVAMEATGVYRLHKIIEDTGIKLDCVASDILGVSGRAMLDGLLAGTTDPGVLAQLARGRLRAKLPAANATRPARAAP